MPRILKPVKNPIGTPKSAVKVKIQNWSHPSVISDEETRDQLRGFDTYTKEEVDLLLIDKANKVSLAEDLNFSKLKSDGDLDDAGFGYIDLQIPGDVINGGTF